jgi:putative sporulation protein YyaC
MEYSFHIYNKLAADGVTMSLDKLLNEAFKGKKEKMGGAGTCSIEKTSNTAAFYDDDKAAPPVVVCIGSDLAIGDSLGPVTGSLLKYKTQGVNCFLYGTLAAPVTAKEIKYLRSFLKKTHPKSQILAIDAAVGEKGDIGVIRITDSPLFPGAGANKQLGCLGDVSILGVVAEKSVSNYGILNTTRLNLVYTMAEIISEGVSALLWERAKKPLSKNA